MMPAPTPETCNVCGEPADDTNAATCNNCERRFHLRLRTDAEGPECGEVWINEQYLALEYACLICLGRAPVAAEPAVGQGH